MDVVTYCQMGAIAPTVFKANPIDTVQRICTHCLKSRVKLHYSNIRCHLKIAFFAILVVFLLIWYLISRGLAVCDKKIHPHSQILDYAPIILVLLGFEGFQMQISSLIFQSRQLIDFHIYLGVILKLR